MRVAAGVLALLVVAALLANVIAPLDDTAVDLDRVLQGPSGAHLIGTDAVGRDLLARVLHGVRISLTIAVLGALAAVAVGALVGTLAGTLGGRVDSAVMRFTDVAASQNHFLFGILLVVLFRPALRRPCRLPGSLTFVYGLRCAHPHPWLPAAAAPGSASPQLPSRLFHEARRPTPRAWSGDDDPGRAA